MSARLTAFAAMAALLAACGGAAASADDAKSGAATANPATHAETCKGRSGWSDPAPPEQIYGNTWYVGTCGITVLLVKTDAGLALFDAGPEDVAPQVLANIRTLGFDPGQVRFIFPSHEHFDHVGAMAGLARATGAEVVTGPWIAKPLESGETAPDDPQYGSIHGFPPITVGQVLRSGGSILLGGVSFTVTATPAHSPGSESWTWQSCENGACKAMAYLDSASTVSADDYRFSDHPERVAAVRQGLRAMATLPCDILMTPHPGASDLFGRLAAGTLEDRQACVAYALDAAQNFGARLAKEAAPGTQ